MQHKNRHEDQWNRIEDPDINPSSYSQLVFDKGTQNIQCKKDSLFINFAAKTEYLHIEDKIDPYLSPCTNINSKWIKDYNRRPKALKLMLERIWNTMNTQA
jgi:hypothetical protein